MKVYVLQKVEFRAQSAQLGIIDMTLRGVKVTVSHCCMYNVLRQIHSEERNCLFCFGKITDMTQEYQGTFILIHDMPVCSRQFMQS